MSPCASLTSIILHVILRFNVLLQAAVLKGSIQVLHWISISQCQDVSNMVLIIVFKRLSLQETLKKAEETFGPDNKDLYLAFEGLLSRHLPS